MPSPRRMASWPQRACRSAGPAAKVPAPGSKISVVPCTVPAAQAPASNAAQPPARSTRPSGRRVALCPARGANRKVGCPTCLPLASKRTAPSKALPLGTPPTLPTPPETNAPPSSSATAACSRSCSLRKTPSGAKLADLGSKSSICPSPPVMSTRPLPRSVARWPARATFIPGTMAHTPSSGPYATASGPAGSASSVSVGVRPNATRPARAEALDHHRARRPRQGQVAGADGEAAAVKVASGGKSPSAVTRTVFTPPGTHAGSVGRASACGCGGEQPTRRSTAAATELRTRVQ